MTTINFEDIMLTDEERQPCEVWTRVMGYLRPYYEFNVGKKCRFFVYDSYSLGYGVKTVFW